MLKLYLMVDSSLLNIRYVTIDTMIITSNVNYSVLIVSCSTMDVVSYIRIRILIAICTV